MKKDLRWLALTVLLALAVPLSATLYQRYKIAGTQLASLEIRMIRPPKDKCRMRHLEGEAAKQMIDLWETDPNWTKPASAGSWSSPSDLAFIETYRDSSISYRILDPLHGHFSIYPTQSKGTGSRLTPKSLRAINKLLAETPTSACPGCPKGDVMCGVE